MQLRPIHLSFVGLAFAAATAFAACSDDVQSSGGPGGSGGSTSQGNGGSGGGGNIGGTGQSGGSGGGGSDPGGAGGVGGAGGDPGNGASIACQQCVAQVYSTDQDCQNANAACDADADCLAWKTCSQGCFASDDTEACYDGCNTAYPHDTDLSDPLLDCTCDNCANVCPATCA